MLKREFEIQMEKLPSVIHHNFTKEEPFFDLAVSIDGEKFHRMVLEEKVAQLNKALNREKQKSGALLLQLDTRQEETSRLRSELLEKTNGKNDPEFEC